MYRPVLKDGGLVAASIGYAIFSGLLPLLSVLIVHILVGLLTEAKDVYKRQGFLHGPVVQLVRMPACHAGGRGFEPHPGRHN